MEGAIFLLFVVLIGLGLALAPKTSFDTIYDQVAAKLGLEGEGASRRGQLAGQPVQVVAKRVRINDKWRTRVRISAPQLPPVSVEPRGLLDALLDAGQPIGDPDFDAAVVIAPLNLAVRASLNRAGRVALRDAVEAGYELEQGTVLIDRGGGMPTDHELAAMIGGAAPLIEMFSDDAPLAERLVEIAAGDSVGPVAAGAAQTLADTFPQVLSAPSVSARLAESRWPQVQLIGALADARPAAADRLAALASSPALDEAGRVAACVALAERDPARGATAATALFEGGARDARLLVCLPPARLPGRVRAAMATEPSAAFRIHAATAAAHAGDSDLARALLDDDDDDVLLAAIDALEGGGRLADVASLLPLTEGVFRSRAIKAAAARAVAKLQSGVDPAAAGGLQVVEADGALTLTED